VSGSVIDIFLVLLIVVFAVNGYRQGFLVGLLSFIGFFGGALLGLQVGPLIADHLNGDSTRVIVSLAAVFGLGAGLAALVDASVVGWVVAQTAAVVVGAGTVVVVVGDSAVGTGAGRDGALPGAGVPAATVGCVLCDVVVGLDGAAAGARRVDVDCPAGASSVVAVAQPSAMSERLAAELEADALVAVPTDALVVRSTGATGPDETTTAVRTAAPSTAFPPATVHQSRRGDRRTACRGLMRGLPARPVPSGAQRPPEAPVR